MAAQQQQPAQAMHIQHIKGFNGRLAGGVAAHPATPGQCFYAVGSSIVTMLEDNPLKQLQLRGHDEQVSALDLSPSGALLASGQRGANSDVVIWDTQSLSQKFRFQEHDLEVVAVAFSHDDRLLATIGNELERRVFVLDAATGKIVTTTKLQDAKRTKAIAWSPVVAAGVSYSFATAADMDVYLWGVGPCSALIHCDRVTMGSVRRAITSLRFSTDGAWLFAGTTSGDVLTINVARKATQLMHSIASAGVAHLQLVPNQAALLAGTLDGSLLLFDQQAALAAGSSGATGSVVAALAQVPGPISSVSVTPGAAGVLLGTQHGDIYKLALGGRQAPVPLLQSQSGALRDCCWSLRTPGSIATASDDGSVCVWDAQTLALEARVSVPNGVAAQCVALSPQLLLSGWSDGDIHCHSRAPQALPHSARQQPAGTPLWCIPSAHARTHTCGVTALQLSNRGDYITSGGAGGELRVWDLASREMVAHLKHHNAAITDLKVLPDDARLMAASEDRTWTLWDVGAEKVTRIFRATMGAVRGVDMAPDQVTAVSVGLDRALTFWDIRQEAPVRTTPNAHVHEATCVAINRRGSVVATGAADCTVKLWDLASGRLLGAFAGHTGTVRRLAFSPNDNRLASAADDGSMVLWRLAV